MTDPVDEFSEAPILIATLKTRVVQRADGEMGFWEYPIYEFEAVINLSRHPRDFILQRIASSLAACCSAHGMPPEMFRIILSPIVCKYTGLPEEIAPSF